MRLWNKNKGGLGKLSGKWEAQLSAAFHLGKYFTGGAEGNLYTWTGNAASKPLKLHSHNLQYLLSTPEGLYSGGDDGLIQVVDTRKGPTIIRTIDLLLPTFRLSKGILSLDLLDDRLLVCTASSSIY